MGKYRPNSSFTLFRDDVKPGITLLCITRDQAPKLMRLLQSVQGAVDDMVVFDTGSKDLSPGVARTHGARVFQIEWPGSFSDAINLAMQEVSTEWTLRLDTDEWLLQESVNPIRALAKRDDAFGYYLIRQDLSDDTHYSEGYMFRMWRSHADLHHVGRIHEHIPNDVLSRFAGKRKIYRVPVAFRHDGFIGGSTESKLRRNLDLLKQELAERPGQAYYEVELALTMHLLSEREAAPCLRNLTDRLIAQGDDARPEPFMANLLGTDLAITPRRDLDSARTKRILELSWKWFDASPPLLWAIAQVELRRKDLQGLYRALIRLEQLSVSGDYDREWTFDARILGEHLWETLARAAGAVGDTETEERNRLRLAK